MKYYKAILSNKQEFVLDETDYQKVVQGLETGSFVRTKKAVINPSFVVTIFPIQQSEALDTEMPERKIEGYVDEESGRFIVTEDKEVVSTELKDEFN